MIRLLKLMTFGAEMEGSNCDVIYILSSNMSNVLFFSDTLIDIIRHYPHIVTF